jgi:hypothetical protein
LMLLFPLAKTTVLPSAAVPGVGHMNTDLQHQLAKHNQLYGETKKMAL